MYLYHALYMPFLFDYDLK